MIVKSPKYKQKQDAKVVALSHSDSGFINKCLQSLAFSLCNFPFSFNWEFSL